jgi:hypothetical protein
MGVKNLLVQLSNCTRFTVLNSSKRVTYIEKSDAFYYCRGVLC